MGQELGTETSRRSRRNRGEMKNVKCPLPLFQDLEGFVGDASLKTDRQPVEQGGQSKLGEC